MIATRLSLACALACGCGDTGPGDTAATSGSGTSSTGSGEIEGTMAPLVMPALWQQQAAADDPLPDHRPAEITCPLGLGWLVEATGFEVNTGSCNYASFSQPSLVPIVRGAQISLELYHFDLLSAEPATAHVAVFLGDHLIFEREIAIPGKAAVYPLDFVSDFDLPAGSPVVLHLHNHGQNTWTFSRLQAEVTDPQSQGP